MNNKKTNLLGLTAGLAITPLLVAGLMGISLAPAASAQEPRSAPRAARQEQPPVTFPPVESPSSNPLRMPLTPMLGAEEPGRQPHGTPLFAMPPGVIRQAMQEGKKEEGKGEPQPAQPELALTPPAPTLATPQFASPGLAPPSATDYLRNAAQGTPSDTISQAQPVGALGAGDLLSKSSGALGVEVQKRSPLVGDPRIEGLHFGQIVTQADGGYWFPARIDLDTVVSKLNASSIGNILIIKGPYSVRYGPGFSFLDIESLPTPRSLNGCFEAHGSSALTYRTNSQGWQGQQMLWGGGKDWGFRLSYDIQAAGDYRTGAGTKMPSHYNNQFVNLAYGVDLSPTSGLEVRYLHVQQTGVLLPGLLTGVNRLTTDAFTGRYTSTQGGWYDRLVFDTWINNTTFDGDSGNPATRQQVQQLNNIFPPGLSPDNQALFNAFGPTRLDIGTAAHALSYGAREITTWGDLKGFNVSLGADIRVFSNNYNEFDAFNLSVINGAMGPTSQPANLGIPYARQIDPGILADTSIPFGDSWLFKLGTRVDFVTSQFLQFGPATDIATYNKNVPGAEGDKAFFLFSGFATAEYSPSDEWTFLGGYGYAQRPPTLTELYSGGAFFGLIQNGLNSVYGNPFLRKEEMHQLNLGFKTKYEDFRAGGNAFFAFLPNYVTYNNNGAFVVTDFAQLRNRRQGFDNITATTPINNLQFVNTKLATLWGMDAYAEYDVLPYLTPFATLNYVQGWDVTKDEPLPGIPPLNTRVGLRFHEAGPQQRWGVEYFARIVGDQNLANARLFEQRTGGFVIHNVRGYWQARENVLLLAGVENFGDAFYREHLDLRTGISVFQPGINFYFGMKVDY